MAQVFVSYSSKNETTALKIVDQIEKAGFSCWIASRDIPGGGSFDEMIPALIRECPVFLLLLSKDSVKSKDVRKELSMASKGDLDNTILPLSLEEYKLPDKFYYHLVDVQILSYYTEPERTMNSVIRQLRTLFPVNVPPKPAAAPAKKPAPAVKKKGFFGTLKDLFVEPESPKSAAKAAAAQPAKPRRAAPPDNGPETLPPEMKEYFQHFIDELEQKINSSGSAAQPSKPKQTVSTDNGQKLVSPEIENFVWRVLNEPEEKKRPSGSAAPPVRQTPHTKRDPVVKSSLYDVYVANKSNQDTTPPKQDTREKRSGGSGASLYDRYGTRENPQKQASASSGTGAEDDYKNAMEWYSFNRYTEAVVWFRKAANKNHAESQYRLAYCYHQGQGVQKDMKQAAYWYRKAAENGHVISMEWMGMFYHYGTAFPRDPDEARKWYQKAIDRGSVYASQQLKLLQLTKKA